MEERRKFGSFYYRFPNGESGADVYDRVDSFWASLVREFSYHHCLENFVLISHGITIRLLLMRYFKWTIEEVRVYGGSMFIKGIAYFTVVSQPVESWCA